VVEESRADIGEAVKRDFSVPRRQSRVLGRARRILPKVFPDSWRWMV